MTWMRQPSWQGIALFSVRMEFWRSTGGTSAVAPLWAGLLAPVNQLLGTSVGYLNPLLYSANVEKAMHDITSGSNGDYSERPGWDACTGLGTPDGAALVTALGGT